MPQKCGDLHKPAFGKASTFVCWDSEHGGKAGGEEAVGGRMYGLEQARHDDRAGGVRGVRGSTEFGPVQFAPSVSVVSPVVGSHPSWCSR